MSESGKSVFLSYASQDVEAAKRIGETLRSAGVGVWFDAEGGLEHGDEWDAKIRRQIKECVLFIPIISANTQAREEGYFRIEWELAAQRALGFASGVAFILPVVIDGTREPDALVPDRFRAVQWTRLPGGEVSADVKARFLKLWSHRIGVVKHEAAQREEAAVPTVRPEAKKRGVNLALVAGAVAVLAVGAFFVLRRGGAPAAKSAPAAAGSAESRTLIAQAWKQLNKAELARAELELADGLCKRATELEPGDADAWAAWSQVDSWYIYHNFDHSPARRESARTKAARALQLAPASFEARLAEACYLVRGPGGSGNGNQGTSMDVGDAESILTGLLREQPAEPRALLARGILQRNLGKAVEARASFEQLARNPAWAALAWNEIGWAEMFGSRDAAYEAAAVAANRSIALQPYWGNLGLRMLIAEVWLGDLDLARASLEQIPAAVRQEDHVIAEACDLYHWRREPATMLQVLESAPRDWLHANDFDGPTAWWAGLAHEIAGHSESAQLQWRSAMKLVEQRLADQPDRASLLELKGALLAKMGRTAEAENAWRLMRENSGGPSVANLPRDATFEASLGHVDAAVDVLERTVKELGPRTLTAAQLRLDPGFDPLRGNPRFQALLARLEADPRFSPKAKISVTAAVPASEPAKTVDEKSVAVLAFTNLSDDKNNEYFSDGISDELITVLQKIPGLHVAARTSAFSFKGKNATAQEIGRTLAVAHIVEGSVQRSDSRVKVSVHLSRAGTGEELWSKSFTREVKDVFALQEELALAIVGELRGRLGGESDAAAVKLAVKGGTTNPEAHEQYLQGRVLEDRHAEAEILLSLSRFQHAVDLDPSFALAWAGLARTNTWLCLFSGDLGRAGFEAHEKAARAACERALALEPDLPEGLLARGEIQTNIDLDWNGADASLRRALALAPADPAVLTAAGNLAGGRGDGVRCLELFRRAVALDPVNPEGRSFLAFQLALIGETDASLREYAEVQKLNPAAPWAFAGAGFALMRMGRNVEAEAEAGKDSASYARLTVVAMARARQHNLAGSDAALAELTREFADTAAYQIAEIQAVRGNKDQAFTWLERARVQRDGGLVSLLLDPFVTDLKTDPRWPAFLRKVGLANDQLQ